MDSSASMVIGSSKGSCDDFVLGKSRQRDIVGGLRRMGGFRVKTGDTVEGWMKVVTNQGAAARRVDEFDLVDLGSHAESFGKPWLMTGAPDGTQFQRKGEQVESTRVRILAQDTEGAAIGFKVVNARRNNNPPLMEAAGSGLFKTQPPSNKILAGAPSMHTTGEGDDSNRKWRWDMFTGKRVSV